MLRKLLTLLLNHPSIGPNVVQRLSETWPIRRAARFTAYIYLRGKSAVEDGLKQQVNQRNYGPQDKSFDLTRFKDTFKKEVLKGVEEAKEDLRRRRP